MKLATAPSHARRPGGIAPLTCVLMVFIIGMVAFSVDMSWLVLTRSELQNVADSAALAGANRLGDNYVAYSLPGQTTVNKTALITGAVSIAKSTAKTYAAANTAGGVSALTLLDADIDVGFTDSSGTYTSNATNAALYPNTIKVTMRRDSSANQSLKMFFAPVIGISNIDVQAQASAMAYGGTINSFKTNAGYAGMLPVTYDVNAWNNFLKTGKNSDGGITTDSNGNPTLQIYPSVKDTGNFGWISLNDSHVGASTMRDWINSGASQSDLQTLVTNKLIPLSAHNANSWDWNGENGFKASNVMDVNNHIGQTYIIPLFTPKDSGSNYQAGVGNGSNYNYNVVQFVGIKIVQPDSTNRQIVVQPVAITDPTILLNSGSVAPLGTSSTFVTALAPPKLSN